MLPSVPDALQMALERGYGRVRFARSPEGLDLTELQLSFRPEEGEDLAAFASRIAPMLGTDAQAEFVVDHHRLVLARVTRAPAARLPWQTLAAELAALAGDDPVLRQAVYDLWKTLLLRHLGAEPGHAPAQRALGEGNHHE